MLLPALYLACGIFFAVAFMLSSVTVQRAEQPAAETLAMFVGCVLVWPLVFILALINLWRTR